MIDTGTDMAYGTPQWYVSVLSKGNLGTEGTYCEATPMKQRSTRVEDFARTRGKNEMMLIARLTAILALSAVIGACSTTKPIAILSTPDNVSVHVNGQMIGTTPTKYEFRFPEKNTRYKVTASKLGYHDADLFISEANLAQFSGSIRISLESYRKLALIASEPTQAKVEIGDIEISVTPVEYAFDFEDRSRRYVVKVSKAGYFENAVTVFENSEEMQAGVITIALEDNPAWRATAESEATNKWLRIPVDPRIPYKGAWQRIIDSVTSVYDSLEQLDQLSGYVRSTPQLRTFPRGPAGPFVVRTQFIGSVSSMEPLTYKIKLIAQTRAKNDQDGAWEDFGRVFAEDAQLVEELQNRMGLK